MWTHEDQKHACRDWAKRHPGYSMRQQAVRRKRKPAKWLLWTAKKRSKKISVEFGICEYDLLPLPEFCPVLGVKLVYIPGGAGACATVDRIDNSKGYVPGNVAIICYRANILKRDGCINEFKALIEYMEKGPRHWRV
jgi:hypothetical protein